MHKAKENNISITYWLYMVLQQQNTGLIIIIDSQLLLNMFNKYTATLKYLFKIIVFIDNFLVFVTYSWPNLYIYKYSHSKGETLKMHTF